MAGLEPAIQKSRRMKLDGRVKPAHGDEKNAAGMTGGVFVSDD
jgi:hypothetical protein